MLLSSSGFATILHKRPFSKVLQDLKAHAGLPLAPSIVAFITDPKSATGLLRTPATTDLDFDGS